MAARAALLQLGALAGRTTELARARSSPFRELGDGALRAAAI